MKMGTGHMVGCLCLLGSKMVPVTLNTTKTCTGSETRSVGHVYISSRLNYNSEELENWHYVRLSGILYFFQGRMYLEDRWTVGMTYDIASVLEKGRQGYCLLQCSGSVRRWGNRGRHEEWMSGFAKKKKREKKWASKAENVEWTSMGETVPKTWKQVLQITFFKYLNIFSQFSVLSSRAWLCQAKYVTSVPLMHLIKSIPACLTDRVEAEHWLALWGVSVWTTAWEGSAFKFECPKEMYLCVWERETGCLMSSENQAFRGFISMQRRMLMGWGFFHKT